jgi:AcrR family transcriptional regulator
MVRTRGGRALKQRRAAETYERLLDAAIQVFAQRGFDGAQTPEIAAAAGVSTGAFYRYFDDKRQCFVEMIERNLERAHADVMARLDPVLFKSGDVRRAIETALAVLFDHVERDGELGRVYQSVSLTDPEVARLRANYESQALESLAALLRAVCPRQVIPQPRAAALVVTLASLEVASERAGVRPRVQPGIPEADVRRALADMLERYLFPALVVAQPAAGEPAKAGEPEPAKASEPEQARPPSDAGGPPRRERRKRPRPPSQRGG